MSNEEKNGFKGYRDSVHGTGKDQDYLSLELTKIYAKIINDDLGITKYIFVVKRQTI